MYLNNIFILIIAKIYWYNNYLTAINKYFKKNRKNNSKKHYLEIT